MKVFLICTRMCDERIFRSMHLLNEILCGEIKPEIVWGFEKNNLTDELVNTVIHPSGMGLTKGEMAVALSHAKCLRNIIECGEPAIILEDDFRLWVEGGVVASDVKRAWDSIPPDTDFECFSKWHVWNPPLKDIGDEPYHRRVELPTFGNQCYYVGVEFAQIMYNHIFPIRAAADVIWRYAPKCNEGYIFRHYYRDLDQDGLIWHLDNASIKDD